MQVAQGVNHLVHDHTDSARVEGAELLQDVLKVPVNVVRDDLERCIRNTKLTFVEHVQEGGVVFDQIFVVQTAQIRHHVLDDLYRFF